MMTNMDLSPASAWTAKSKGIEQYAAVPFGPDSMLAGESLTVQVVCDCQPFTLKDRDHAQARWEALERNLPLALDRMMLHLGFASRRELLERYGEPTVMLAAGDYENWSISFDRRAQPSSSVFCDWHNDEIGEVWVAD